MNRRGPMGPLHPGIHNETGGGQAAAQLVNARRAWPDNFQTLSP